MAVTPEQHRVDPIVAGPLAGPILWRGADLADDAGRLPIEPAAIAEIEAVLAFLAANPLPVEAIRPEHFQMPACARLMARVRDALHGGQGFAIVDRLPVERIAPHQHAAIHWLLAAMVARPVAQKWQGDMTYEVTDAGRSIDPLGAAALQALEDAMNAPGQAKAFWFEPGQIQFVNNRLIGHRRTAFRDWPQPDRKRLLYRLWLRDRGRPFYNG